MPDRRNRYLLQKSSEDMADVLGIFIGLFIKLCWFLLVGVVKITWWCLVGLFTIVSRLMNQQKVKSSNQQEVKSYSHHQRQRIEREQD